MHGSLHTSEHKLQRASQVQFEARVFGASSCSKIIVFGVFPRKFNCRFHIPGSKLSVLTYAIFLASFLPPKIVPPKVTVSDFKVFLFAFCGLDKDHVFTLFWIALGGLLQLCISWCLTVSIIMARWFALASSLEPNSSTSLLLMLPSERHCDTEQKSQ